MKKINLFYLMLIPYSIFFWEFIVGRWIVVIGAFVLIYLHSKYENAPVNTVLMLIAFQAYSLFSRLFLLPGDVVRGSMGAGVAGGMFLMIVIVVTPFLVLFPLDVLYKKDKRYILLLLVSLIILGIWLSLIYLDGRLDGPTTLY